MTIKTRNMHLFTVGICFLFCLVCSQAAKDVVFVLDRSGSLDASDVADALEFIYNVSKWMTIGTNNTLISLVTYSDDVKEEFKLNSHPNKTDLLSVIYGLRGMSSGGGTYTYNALGQVLSSSFTVLNGGRPNVSKAVVVMTDGASNDLSRTAQMADQLRSDLGAEVYAIGIGESIDKDELSAISSDPDSYYGLSVHDFVYLCNLVPTLVLKLDSSANATISKGCPVYTTPGPTMTTTTHTSTSTDVAITAHLLTVPENSSSTTALALGISFGLLVLIASIIIVFYLRKKRPCRSRKPKPVKEKQDKVVRQNTLTSILPKPLSYRESMFNIVVQRQSTNVSILDLDT